MRTALPTSLNADPMQIAPETLWNMLPRDTRLPVFAAAFALSVGIRPARLADVRTALAHVGDRALCLACVFMQYHGTGRYPLLRSASGFGLAARGVRHVRSSAACGRSRGRDDLSFGVYLSHVVFIRLAMATICTSSRRAAQRHERRVVRSARFRVRRGHRVLGAWSPRSRYTRWIIGCEMERMRARSSRSTDSLCDGFDHLNGF